MIYLIGTAAMDARARFDDHISVLPVQNIGPMGIWLKPSMWYMTTLMPNAPEPGNVPEHKARLAIRLDNFYIVGKSYISCGRVRFRSFHYYYYYSYLYIHS